MKTYLLLFGLCCLAIFSFIASLKWGTINTPWSALLGQGSINAEQIIWQLRLPVALNAFIAGGLLGLSGAILQILLRNPLADPYILGVSGGSATATLAAIILGVSPFGYSVAGFGGACLATLFVYVLAYTQRAQPQRLLLAGVILATGWGAAISLLLTLSPNHDLQGILFWLLGDVNHYRIPWFPGSVLILSIAYSIYLAPQLNLLARGTLVAESLGISVRRLEKQLFFFTALLTACAVATVGTIGFIGLIVPHLLRLLHTTDHHFILPGSVLLGGSFLCGANAISVYFSTSTQLPAGIITTLIGVPIFIVLLFKK